MYIKAKPLFINLIYGTSEQFLAKILTFYYIKIHILTLLQGAFSQINHGQLLNS